MSPLVPVSLMSRFSDSWQAMQGYDRRNLSTSGHLSDASWILGATGERLYEKFAQLYMQYGGQLLGMLLNLNPTTKALSSYLEMYGTAALSAFSGIQNMGLSQQYNSYVSYIEPPPNTGPASAGLVWDAADGAPLGSLRFTTWEPQCELDTDGWFAAIRPKPPGALTSGQVLDYFRAFELLRQLSMLTKEDWDERHRVQASLIQAAQDLTAAGGNAQALCGDGIRQAWDANVPGTTSSGQSLRAFSSRSKR
jgi:hypothetical protein